MVTHLGINLHISEIVSDILDPIVASYRGGKEIISTEDMVARLEIKNESNRGWSPTSYWGGKKFDEYAACEVCDGDDEYEWDEEHPELCKCEDYRDGVDEEGYTLVTREAMKGLRSSRWRIAVGWDDQDLDRRYGAKEVLPEAIQDQTIPMVVVGTDVVNLYPSLIIKKVVGEVGEAILDSEVKFEEMDYLEGARYIALNWTERKCRSSPLWRILPRRRKKQGSRPGLTGEGPMGAVRGDQEQWEFPRVKLTMEERRLIVATVVELATEAMFNNHFYGFGGKKFKQMEGGPIGLRGTCTLARLVMQIFDRRWMDLVRDAGLSIDLYMRYMDDGRKLLQPIRRGWRWVNGALVYTLRWDKEDEVKTAMEVTVGVLRDTVKRIADYLDFTFESGDDYPDGWLPTLDVSIKVNDRNTVDYRYFEKPTTTNTTVRERSAMGENSKIQCLSNDLVRRLMNTKEELPASYRAEVVDKYGIKLMTSGFTREQSRKILMNGIKGYVAKRDRRRASGRKRIHLTAEETSQARSKRKLLGKSSWYRGGKKKKDEVQMTKVRKPGGGTKPSTVQLRTRAVLFLEQTPHGELARRMKEQLQRLEPTLGFKIKVVERTGVKLSSILSQSKLGGGKECGREQCVTCSQEGEEKPDCTRSGVVYESICVVCNPSCMEKGDLKK